MEPKSLLGEVLLDREAGRLSRSAANVVREISEFSHDFAVVKGVKNTWEIKRGQGYVIGTASVKGALRSLKAAVEELKRLEPELEALIGELDNDGQAQP